MTLNQTNPPPHTGPIFEDLTHPDGVAKPDAPAPAWYLESMKQVTDAIFQVVHFNQHEYLDHRRLPHAIKRSEILTSPYVMQNGEVVIGTVFPVASELSFVVYLTPKFSCGHNQMEDGDPTDDLELVDYDIFAYKEGIHSVVNNVPQRLTDWLQAEIKRQARELKIRNLQFLYFTIVKPLHGSGFEDPHGYLSKQTVPAGVQMPTPV